LAGSLRSDAISSPPSTISEPLAGGGWRRQAAPVNRTTASKSRRLGVVVTGGLTGQFIGRRKKARQLQIPTG
jgi:hypothetical protein